MTKFEKFLVLLNVSGLIFNAISATLDYMQGIPFVVPLILGILNTVAIVLSVAMVKAPEETEDNTQ